MLGTATPHSEKPCSRASPQGLSFLSKQSGFRFLGSTPKDSDSGWGEH